MDMEMNQLGCERKVKKMMMHSLCYNFKCQPLLMGLGSMFKSSSQTDSLISSFYKIIGKRKKQHQPKSLRHDK
jgi:hypothetical protein